MQKIRIRKSTLEKILGEEKARDLAEKQRLQQTTTLKKNIVAMLSTWNSPMIQSGMQLPSSESEEVALLHGLDARFLKDREAHEVLAFPQEEISQSEAGGFVNPPDNILRLGDIVLCWPEVLESASRQDSMVDDQLYFLTGHATEHLLGKHHE